MQPAATLTVASGGTTSNLVRLDENRRYNVTIFAPATVDGTPTVEVCDSFAAPVWRTLVVGGSDVTIAAAKAIQISDLQAAMLRIKQGTAGAERVYVLLGTAR